MKRLVLISDTHRRRPEIPDGDILIHAGDFTGLGRSGEIKQFARFLAGQPHRHKIVIAGNHDFLFEQAPGRARALLKDFTYLQDSGVEVEGLKIWGTPWQPWFLDWAFNVHEEEARAQIWAQIPFDTDVLVTHSPPYGILDLTHEGVHAGCRALRARVEAIRPTLHVFGHIHEGYGSEEHGGTLFINAAQCDARNQLMNPPVVVDLDEKATL